MKTTTIEKLAQQLKKKKDIADPEALAAWIGRKKHGKNKFQKMAVKGREDIQDLINKVVEGADPKELLFEVKLAKDPEPLPKDAKQLTRYAKQLGGKKLVKDIVIGPMGGSTTLPAWSFSDEDDAEEFATFADDELKLYADVNKYKGKWIVSVGRRA